MADITNECLSKLKIALKKFGDYNFFDKGPSEVMDIRYLAKRFRELNVNDAIETFKGILKEPEYGERLASSIFCELEDWDDLWNNNEEFLKTFH